MSYIVYLENSGDGFFTIDADKAEEQGEKVVFYKNDEVVSRIAVEDVRTYLPTT